MVEERKFARFRPQANPDRMVFTVPEDGLCLSTFLLLRPRGHRDRVLLGRLNPEAPWGHIGSLDAPRAASWSKGWMLPSSQLVYYESPEESARRIAHEQLGLVLGELSSPMVMSDSEQRPAAVAGDLHWDIGFVYLLDGFPQTPPRHPAWSELRFLEVSKIPRRVIMRSQADVLGLAGIPCAD
jgi:ADP-ribose pyrophosphatase YjhB (NUDIX family)